MAVGLAMRWKTILGLAVLGGGLACGQAGTARAGQVEDLGPEGQWITDCSMDRMTDMQTCRLILYRLLADPAGQGGRAVAISVVPVNRDYALFLSIDRAVVDRCALRVDRHPRLESTVAAVNTCVFSNFAVDKMADTFRDGTTVLTRFAFKDGSQQDIDFSLKGFRDAFDEMANNLR